MLCPEQTKFCREEMRYMSRRLCFEQKINFFLLIDCFSPGVLRRKHLEQWCIPVVPAWSVEFCQCGVAHMHSGTDGGFVSHRWAPVFHSSCAPGHTQKTAFPFICGISFLVMAHGMIAMWQWGRQAPVLCSCCRRGRWCQQHIMSTESDCRPTHCHPKCRTKPGLTSGVTKMCLLQWSCAVFSVAELSAGAGAFEVMLDLLSMQVFCWDQLFRALKSLSTLPHFH